MISWVRTVDPLQEPITVEEAKQQARITHDQEDGLLQSYIRTAREAAEDYLNRGLFTQTWKLVLDRFAEVIYLPMVAPLQSVSTVKYYDENGTLQTLSNTVYTVDTVSRPGRITRGVNQTWPVLQADRLSGSVEITYVVGWTTQALIPERIKQGIRHYVTYLELDREGLEPGGDGARKAAEACWSDRVTWMDPICMDMEWP